MWWHGDYRALRWGMVHSEWSVHNGHYVAKIPPSPFLRWRGFESALTTLAGWLSSARLLIELGTSVWHLSASWTYFRTPATANTHGSAQTLTHFLLTKLHSELHSPFLFWGFSDAAESPGNCLALVHVSSKSVGLIHVRCHLWPVGRQEPWMDVRVLPFISPVMVLRTAPKSWSGNPLLALVAHLLTLFLLLVFPLSLFTPLCLNTYLGSSLCLKGSFQTASRRWWLCAAYF